MKTVTHREMRNNSGQILRDVAAGETYRVTNNGVVAAIISPPYETELDRLRAMGELRPATRPATDLLKIKRVKSSVTTEEIIADLRGNR